MGLVNRRHLGFLTWSNRALRRSEVDATRAVEVVEEAEIDSIGHWSGDAVESFTTNSDQMVIAVRYRGDGTLLQFAAYVDMSGRPAAWPWSDNRSSRR